MRDAKRTRRLTAPKPARIAIVDDHPLVREGLAARISAQSDLEVCGEASDTDEALALIRATQPMLVIVDLALKSGSGLDLIKKLMAEAPQAKILFVSAYEESLFAERTLRAGAHGYINKQELQGKVIEAIRAVLRGEHYLSAEMAQRLMAQAIAGKPLPRGADALTDRELQIFELIGQGKSTRSIAQQLHLSVHTIESHRENIRAKLSLRNGTELVQRAVQWRLENARQDRDSPSRG
jgi:DNA-binding NarL/FixJ family response regulator